MKTHSSSRRRAAVLDRGCNAEKGAGKRPPRAGPVSPSQPPPERRLDAVVVSRPPRAAS